MQVQRVRNEVKVTRPVNLIDSGIWWCQW